MKRSSTSLAMGNTSNITKSDLSMISFCQSDCWQEKDYWNTQTVMSRIGHFLLEENENALHNLAVHSDTVNEHALIQQFHKTRRKKYKNVHVEKALFERGKITGTSIICNTI